MINNLKLEFGEKGMDYLNGDVHRLRVVLKNDDGAYYPVFFEPDKINLSDAELYQMALEVNYQKNSSGRAEDERFNLLGEKIAKYDELIEKSQNAINDLEEATAEAKAATIKNEEAVNNAVSELTELAMGILIKKGIFTTKFTKNHQIVKSWVALVLTGTYTVDQVPKLFNLREVVKEELIAQGFEDFSKEEEKE